MQSVSDTLQSLDKKCLTQFNDLYYVRLTKIEKYVGTS